MGALLQLKKLIGKAISALLFNLFNGCSCSIKKINRLIWKGMFWHLLLRKTNVLETSIFSKRKFEEMH